MATKARKIEKKSFGQCVSWQLEGTLPLLSLVYRMYLFFYVVRTVHFGMKLYKDQRNAQVLNLFIDLLLPYMFRAFF
jgi:hypothetical protein